MLQINEQEYFIEILDLLDFCINIIKYVDFSGQYTVSYCRPAPMFKKKKNYIQYLCMYLTRTLSCQFIRHRDVI